MPKWNSLKEKLEAYVEKIPDGCWNWTGGTNGIG